MELTRLLPPPPVALLEKSLVELPMVRGDDAPLANVTFCSHYVVACGAGRKERERERDGEGLPWRLES